MVSPGEMTDLSNDTFVMTLGCEDGSIGSSPHP
jgi:hypothetical protein